ncbi:MAG TPA: YqaE/Pmp3 family membrane protein [Gemmata sp.]|nr:YqaE/Pmp3 family membrane protein [Gemmata sp.]
MTTLLAIVCPPLAVLATGTPSRAAANLGLTLMGFVPGVVHALRVVEQYSLESRYASVMRALSVRAT